MKLGVGITGRIPVTSIKHVRNMSVVVAVFICLSFVQLGADEL
jgi:hypothetical protein